MEGLWVLAPILICPVVMGLMMLFMMRGRKNEGSERASDDSQEEG